MAEKTETVVYNMVGDMVLVADVLGIAVVESEVVYCALSLSMILQPVVDADINCLSDKTYNLHHACVQTQSVQSFSH